MFGQSNFVIYIYKDCPTETYTVLLLCLIFNEVGHCPGLIFKVKPNYEIGPLLILNSFGN